MRVFLILVAVLLCVIVGLLFAAPLLVDAARYRTEIETVATRAVGQPVRINGDLSFRILPTPRLVAERIVVAPPAQLSDMQPPMTADQAEILLSARELLAGRTVARSISLTAPVFTLHTDLAGHRNLASGTSPDLDVGQLRIQGGSLVYRDEKQDRRFSVRDIEGTVDTDRDLHSSIATFSAILDGRRLDLEVRLSGLTQRSAAAMLQVAGIGTADYRGRLDESGWLNTSGEIKISLDNLADLLPEAVVSEDTGHQIPLKASGALMLDGQSLTVDRISGQAAGAAFDGRLGLAFTDICDIDAAVAFEQLDGDKLVPWLTAIARRAINGEIALDGETPVRASLQLDLGLVSFATGFARQISMNAGLDGGVISVRRLAALLPGGSDFSYAGDVRLTEGAFRLDGDIEFASDNLAALLQTAGAPVRPEGHGRLRNLSLAAGLVMDGSVAQISGVDLRFDQSRVTGGVAVALVRRPSFSLNLTIDQINANAYAALFEGEEEALRLLKGDPSQPSLPVLNTFDTNTTLRIGRLIAGGSVARGIRLEAGLLGGALDIKTFAVSDLDGGTLELSGQIDTPDNPQWLLKGEVSSENPGRMFGGAVGAAAPALARAGGLTASFSLEGGPARSAIEAAIFSSAWEAQVSGLWSQVFGDGEFDLDIDLSAADSRKLLRQAFPAWNLPATIAGPLIAAGQLKGGLTRFRVEGRADAMAARVEVNGELAGLAGERPEYALDLRLRHGDLLTLLKSLIPRYMPASGDPLPLDVTMRVEGDGARTRFGSISASAGENRLKGEVDVDWRQQRPVVQARVTEAEIEADRMLPGGGGSAVEAAIRDNRAFRWSRLPLEWPWMQDVDLSAAISFVRMALFGVRFDAGNLQFDAGPDGWSVTQFDAALGDGTVEGQLLFDTGVVPSSEVMLQARSVPASDLLVPFLGVDPGLSGAADLNVELTGKGLTQFDMVRALSGHVEILAGTTLRGADGEVLEALAGRFEVSGGVARASGGLESEDGSRVLGSVDLGEWQADLEVRRPDSGAGQAISGPLFDLRVSR